MKKDKYTKTLAKNQVCEIFQMRDIGKNSLPKFIRLCMETPCWNIPEHSGTFRNIPEHAGTLRNIPEHPGT